MTKLYEKGRIVMGQAKLSKKDEKFRDFALNGNMWSVLIATGTPLALYQTLGTLFKILDSMMASHISAESVSAVAYLFQILQVLSSVGGGLATGGSLKISQAYGAGDYEMVKKRVSTLFGICAGLGGLVIVGIIPFSKQLLYLVKTPESLIAIGNQYFIVELFALVITFLNNVYIAVERARGNSKRILYLNLIVTALKLGLTALFVYVLDGTIVMIGVATLLSQSFMLLAGIINMNQKGNAFGFSLKSVQLKKEVLDPMFQISFPIMVEKCTFSFGKVVVNSMSGIYGALTVGALGISNNMNGLTTSAQNGFQEGAAAVISQNLGAGNKRRVLEAFWKVLVLNMVVGIIGLSLTMVFLEQLSSLFAVSQGGWNREFQEMIMAIYRYEAWGGAIPLGINAAVMALLFGLGYTKITLLINFLRIFLFRIPVLLGLQHFTSLGSEAVGVVMLVSNTATGLMALIAAFFVVSKVKKEIRNKEAEQMHML